MGKCHETYYIIVYSVAVPNQYNKIPVTDQPIGWNYVLGIYIRENLVHEAKQWTYFNRL